MIGIGLYTNGINPRAVAAKWMAGANSMMNDVRFLGGHGTNRLDGSRDNPYNNTHTADPELARRWDGQYPSLWVTDGGGGTFFDIWTPSTFAQAGMLVSNTSTAGRVYQMSSEHHVRYEVQLHNVSNWQLYALQTEEERGEGGFALPLEIEGSQQYHGGELPHLSCDQLVSAVSVGHQGLEIEESSGSAISTATATARCRSMTRFTMQTHARGIRQREFAWLNVSGSAPVARRRRNTAGARVEKLAGGFFNISGGAVDPAGDFYFVDATGSASIAGRRRNANSRRCATIRSTRSTWRSTRRAI